MAEWRPFADPDPSWKDFPNNLPPGTPIVWMTRDRLPINPHPTLSIEEFTIPASSDAYLINVRTYRRKRDSFLSDPECLPLMVYMHGGGWVTGSLETDDETCRLMALEHAMVVLSIEYRLAPENPFPVGIEDCKSVVEWCASSIGQKHLSADLAAGFVLAGTSAGAQFSASLAYLLHHEGLSPPLTGMIFLAGNIIDTDALPPQYKDKVLSVDEITNAPGLNREAVEHFAKLYGAVAEDGRRSPLVWQAEGWKLGEKNMKVYLAVCGWDPRRDEALLFDEILREDGHSTMLKVYKGLPHGFWTVCPDFPTREMFHKDLLEAVGWILKQ